MVFSCISSRVKTKLVIVSFGIGWFVFMLFIFSLLSNKKPNEGKQPGTLSERRIYNFHEAFQGLSVNKLLQQVQTWSNDSVHTNSQREKEGLKGINVITSGDETSILGVVALINSIRLNTKRRDYLHFFVMLPKKLIDHFDNWIKASNDLSQLKLTVREHATEAHERKSPLAKLFVLDVFPEIQGQFIYIDSDAVVQGDIFDLANATMKENEVALLPSDCHGIYKHVSNLHPYYSSHLNFSHSAIKSSHLSPNVCTFNSGVMIGNATKWHQHKIVDLIHRWVKVDAKGPSIVGVDPYSDLSKAVLLIVFYNRFGHIPLEWHFGYLGAKRSSSLSPHYLSKFKLLEWNGRYKPWYRKTPFANIWYKYYVPDPKKTYKIKFVV